MEYFVYGYDLRGISNQNSIQNIHSKNVDCKLRVSGQRLLSLSVNVLYLYQKCRNLAVNVIIFIRDNLLDFIIDCLQIKKICLNQRNRLTISTYKKNRSIAVCFYANFQTKKNPHQMILCIFAEKTTKVRIQCGVLFAFEWITTVFFFGCCFYKRIVNVDWMRINASVIPNNGRESFKKTNAGERSKSVSLNILADLMCDVLCSLFMAKWFDEIPQRFRYVKKSKMNCFPKQ